MYVGWLPFGATLLVRVRAVVGIGFAISESLLQNSHRTTGTCMGPRNGTPDVQGYELEAQGT